MGTEQNAHTVRRNRSLYETTTKYRTVTNEQYFSSAPTTYSCKRPQVASHFSSDPYVGICRTRAGGTATVRLTSITGTSASAVGCASASKWECDAKVSLFVLWYKSHHRDDENMLARWLARTDGRTDGHRPAIRNPFHT